MCNKCKENNVKISNPCNNCPPPLTNCGCNVTVGFECVRYNGVDLPYLDVVRGMNGESVLEKVNDALFYLNDEIKYLEVPELPNPAPTPVAPVKVVKGYGTEVVYNGIDTYTVSVSDDFKKELYNKLKEELMAFLIFNIAEANTFERCIQLTDAAQKVVKTLKVATPISESALLSVKLRNTCSGTFTLPQTVIYNANGVTVTLRELTIPSGAQVSPTVDITGTWNGSVGVVPINGKVNNVPLLVDLNVLAQDTYASCIRIAQGSVDTPTNITVLKNGVNNQSVAGITIENTCSVAFTQPEVVVIDEDGLRVVLPSTEIPANGNKVINFNVTGAYRGTKDALNGVVSINGAQHRVNVTVTDHAPIANDVTFNLANRENRFFDATNLQWSDGDGDVLEAIKFSGDVSKIFVVPTSDSAGVAAKSAVVVGTEYAPATKFYFAAPDQNEVSTYQVTYQVKAGGKWSN